MVSTSEMSINEINELRSKTHTHMQVPLRSPQLFLSALVNLRLSGGGAAPGPPARASKQHDLIISMISSSA